MDNLLRRFAVSLTHITSWVDDAYTRKIRAQAFTRPFGDGSTSLQAAIEAISRFFNFLVYLAEAFLEAFKAPTQRIPPTQRTASFTAPLGSPWSNRKRTLGNGPTASISTPP